MAHSYMAASVGKLGDWDWCYMVASVGNGANYNWRITIGTVTLGSCGGSPRWLAEYAVVYSLAGCCGPLAASLPPFPLRSLKR